MIIAILITSIIAVAIGFVIAILLYAQHSSDDFMIELVITEYDCKLKDARFICSKCGAVLLFHETIFDDAPSAYCHKCYEGSAING